jgi:protein CrcB
MRADDPGREPLPVDPDRAAGPDDGAGTTVGKRSGPLVRKGMLAAVALGGLLGGLARYLLDLAFPTPAGGFPLTTFAVNVSGSFVLALLLVFVLEIWAPTRYVRPLAAVGFLGAFTTFSTWMVDTDRLLGDGHYAVAALNVFGSLFAGLAATSLGLATGRAVRAGRARAGEAARRHAGPER